MVSFAEHSDRTHPGNRIVCTAPSEQCEDFRGELAETIAHRRVADRLAALVQKERINLIHLNYEGLFLLAGFLKRRTGLQFFVTFGRICRKICGGNGWSTGFLDVDHLLFISPMEEARVRKLQTRHSADGTVIWGMSAPPLERRPASWPAGSRVSWEHRPDEGRGPSDRYSRKSGRNRRTAAATDRLWRGPARWRSLFRGNENAHRR